MVSVEFANQLGWYAFIGLIVLILLYLIRPKPRNTTIPSLMFFIRTGGITKQNAFLRNLINNLLFLLQFLTLATIAFALTYPYISVPKESVQEDTVIVLDISASMQTKQNGITRFDRAVSTAKGSFGSTTSIVLASNIPIVALEKGSSDKAQKILSSLSPKDTSSNIGDAMLMAANILGNKGKVIVISDMKQTDGLDIEAAAKALSARDLDVELKNVGGDADNAGITELKVTKREIKASVKNFADRQKTITLALFGDNKAVKQEKAVLPNSIETFSFETPTGISELRIEQKDDLDVDNAAYVVGPNTKKIKVLLVSNTESSSIRTALLSSPDIELKTAAPPVIPSLDYDIIVLNKFSKELLLPGFFEDAGSRVKKGADLIIAAQDDINKIDFKLMPVKVEQIIRNETAINVAVENQFTSGIEFGRSTKYFEAESNDAVVLLETESGIPLMAVREEGDGAVVYYGIFDEDSDFRNSVGYPIFWNKMVNYLYSTQNLGELNTRTDKIMPIEKQKVITPYGEIETNRIFFDKTGIYTIGDRNFASGLLNEKESDVSSKAINVKSGNAGLEKTDEMARKSFVKVLSLFALILIMLELAVAKVRGDI